MIKQFIKNIYKIKLINYQNKKNPALQKVWHLCIAKMKATLSISALKDFVLKWVGGTTMTLDYNKGCKALRGHR